MIRPHAVELPATATVPGHVDLKATSRATTLRHDETTLQGTVTATRSYLDLFVHCVLSKQGFSRNEIVLLTPENPYITDRSRKPSTQLNQHRYQNPGQRPKS